MFGLAHRSMLSAWNSYCKWRVSREMRRWGDGELSLVNALGICTGNLIVLIAVAIAVCFLASKQQPATCCICHMLQGVHLHFKQLLPTKNLISKVGQKSPENGNVLDSLTIWLTRHFLGYNSFDISIEIDLYWLLISL